MKKKFYIIVDTETTERGNVADFGAVVCDKRGNIVKKIGVLTPYFQKEKLFYNRDSGFFGIKNLNIRTEKYRAMVKDRKRTLATIRGGNAWLEKVAEMYSPTLTAYNLPFDKGACKKSGIVLPFENEFCLWKEAARIFGKRVTYINHVLEHKAISEKLNIKTNADIMSKYLSVETLNDEPHTALEDILFHELVIFKEIMRQKKGIKNVPYNWRNHRLIDHVIAKRVKR